MARTCATVANSSGFRTGPPAQEKDFLPDFGPRELEWQPLDEMKRVASRVAAIGGGE